MDEKKVQKVKLYSCFDCLQLTKMPPKKPTSGNPSPESVGDLSTQGKAVSNPKMNPPSKASLGPQTSKPRSPAPGKSSQSSKSGSPAPRSPASRQSAPRSPNPLTAGASSSKQPSKTSGTSATSSSQASRSTSTRSPQTSGPTRTTHSSKPGGKTELATGNPKATKPTSPKASSKEPNISASVGGKAKSSAPLKPDPRDKWAHDVPLKEKEAKITKTMMIPGEKHDVRKAGAKADHPPTGNTNKMKGANGFSSRQPVPEVTLEEDDDDDNDWNAKQSTALTGLDHRDTNDDKQSSIRVRKFYIINSFPGLV